MTDYGHELQFGSFITPTANPPEAPVALAQASEQAGLDLVTFQDHPYQPAFLDTWTLMSAVATATVRVQIAPNVINLPLRPAAVLGRAAASLDLLSGGRFNLGLGTGAFWDAIEGMGGTRLSPGESVRALDEAIDIIQQLWDTETRGGVRVDGAFHRAQGAKRGPAPAHPIPLWIGAYGPRMLRLVGRRADGWLPSQGYLKPGQLAQSNATIDAAATKAGRSPNEIVRLLNIGPPSGSTDRWVAELVSLALDDGISVFILGSDDPELINTFGTVVAPAVREQVEASRLTPGVPGPTGVSTPATETASRPSAGGVARHPFSVTPTPDDGHRHSSTRLWDENTRPTGPEVDPERTYTDHDLAQGQHLIDIHDHLRAELETVRDLEDQVLEGIISVGNARSQLNELTLRQNKWTLGTYCQQYCRILTGHHNLEDQAMFPRLKRLDPRLGDVVDRLEDEHVIIHDVVEAVDDALIAFVGEEDDGEALRDTVNLLTDTLLSHLSYEERELVEPLARLGLT